MHFAIMGRTPPPSVGRLLKDTYVPLVQAAAGRYGEGFLAAIDRALAVRPEARTQTIEQFRREVGLGDVAAVEPYTTKPLPPGAVPPRPTPPPRVATPAPAPAPAAEPRRSNATLIGIGAGVVVLGAVGFGVWKAMAPVAAPPAVVAAVPAPPPAASIAVAVPPPAPAVAAPTALDPDTEFARVVAGQSAGFAIEPKLPKKTLKIGRDELAFTLRSERDGYLYVMVSDGHGTLLGLLPNNVMGAVRVKKGEAFRFPLPVKLATGEEHTVVLNVSEPPGPAKILFVVSAVQRDLRALKPRRDGTFNFYPNGAEGAPVVAAHAGPQPLLVGTAICPASGACDDSYGAAVADFDVVR